MDIMTFNDVELQLNNLGLSLNSDLTVTVSSDEEAEDAIMVLEEYFNYDSGSEFVRIVWSDAN